MKTTLTVLAVLCLATFANAGYTVAVGDPVDVGNGLLSYTVSLVGTDGDLPVAWDGVFTGPMNQVKVMSFDTPSMSYAMLLPNIAQDTHFLFADSAVTIPAGKAPSETPTSLTAAFSYGAPFTASRVLAQIVLPVGQTAELVSQTATGQGVKFDTNATIPEPATLSLLGLGALALRRRK